MTAPPLPSNTAGRRRAPPRGRRHRPHIERGRPPPSAARPVVALEGPGNPDGRRTMATECCGPRTSPRRAAGRGHARADSPRLPPRRAVDAPSLTTASSASSGFRRSVADCRSRRVRAAARPRRALIDHLHPRLLHLDVGHDAFGLDRGSCGRVIARGGQADRAVAGQRHDGLDRALAEPLGPHHDRPVMILQGSGDDLRGGRRTTIDQDDHRPTFDQVAAARVEALDVVGPGPRVDTISPRSRKTSATATACSSSPPGLLRRSTTTPLRLGPGSPPTARSRRAGWPRSAR